MTITKISIDNTETNVKEYICTPDDAVESYPVNCGKGSGMIVKGINSNLPIAELMFDGVKWVYTKQEVSIKDLYEFDIIKETVGMNAFEVQVGHKPVKNASMEIKYDIPEIIRATVVGDVTKAGELIVTLTSKLYEDDKIYGVVVALEDTAIEVAQKIVDGIKPHLEADFIVEALDEIVQLTVKVPTTNDTTLNLSIVQDDAEGLTDDATSVITQVGAVNDKGIVVYDFPTRCELTLEILATAPAELTFPTGTVWDTEAPTIVAGKTYLIKFYTKNGGTSIRAKLIGTW